ncbi:hypothetical protein ACIQKE_30540 [Streptomyces griseoviridis]|uniref:hypothetical protein n=1 Tax=Streptomyces TaxID=1883 RepID=UPI0024748551|nr:hypothetical protein [Streptomyces sp. MAA16]MDH6703087.1 hypothetical protein [Streptomyces sp. MAA16]
MANTVPHDDSHRRTGTAERPGRADLAAFLLWSLLVISGLANAVASATGAGTWTHLACGAVTALSATALAVRALRARGGRR